MDLSVVTPDNQEVSFQIEDWEPINERDELSEVGLIMRSAFDQNMLQHALEYHSITCRTSKEFSVIINKPLRMTSTPNTLTLIFTLT